jgi:hypothetical protein
MHKTNIYSLFKEMSTLFGEMSTNKVLWFAAFLMSVYEVIKHNIIK